MVKIFCCPGKSRKF